MEKQTLLNILKLPHEEWDLSMLSTDDLRFALETYENDYQTIMQELAHYPNSMATETGELKVLQKVIQTKYNKLLQEFFQQIHLQTGSLIIDNQQAYYFVDDMNYILQRIKDNLMQPENIYTLVQRPDAIDTKKHNVSEWFIKTQPIWADVTCITEIPKGTLLKNRRQIGFLERTIVTTDATIVIIKLNNRERCLDIEDNIQYLTNQKNI